MRKRYFLVLSLLLIAILISACSSEPAEVAEEDSMEVMTFTLDELAKYDGKDGNKAYIAVDGIVYDVTDVSAWTGGMHNGNMAGLDVTDVIKGESPHGLKVLDNLEKVGELE